MEMHDRESSRIFRDGPKRRRVVELRNSEIVLSAMQVSQLSTVITLQPSQKLKTSRREADWGSDGIQFFIRLLSWSCVP